MTRILLIVPMLTLLGAAPQPAANSPQIKPTRVVSPVPSICERTASYAQGEPGPAEMKRLGQLPPADAYMAVYRTDADGCLDPLLARDRQGIRHR